MATYWENSCSFGLRYVSWYKYLIVSLVFSHLGFWSGNLFLIAPFPDLCLLVPFFLCLNSLVCVRSVRKPHCWFSHETAHFNDACSSIKSTRTSTSMFRLLTKPSLGMKPYDSVRFTVGIFYLLDFIFHFTVMRVIFVFIREHETSTHAC